MILGAHIVLFSSNPDSDKAFLKDVLRFDSVDAGGGWLVFALPPAEVAIHPAEQPGTELYLMCDDLEEELRILASRGVTFSPVEQASWGSVTKVQLPSGAELGLYQPTHPTPVAGRE